MDEHVKSLRLLLYRVLFAKNISDPEFIKKPFITNLVNEYSEEIMQSIVTALRWIGEHPDYDLRDALPHLAHSNADLHAFLDNILKALEDKTITGHH